MITVPHEIHVSMKPDGQAKFITQEILAMIWGWAAIGIPVRAYRLGYFHITKFLIGG